MWLMFPKFSKIYSKGTYYIEEKLVPTADSHKDLGILVTADLSWSKHINFICANAYKTLHLIYRSVSSTSLGLRKSVYLSLVRSKLSYCSQLWRPHLVKDIYCASKVFKGELLDTSSTIIHDILPTNPVWSIPSYLHWCIGWNYM